MSTETVNLSGRFTVAGYRGIAFYLLGFATEWRAVPYPLLPACLLSARTGNGAHDYRAAVNRDGNRDGARNPRTRHEQTFAIKPEATIKPEAKEGACAELLGMPSSEILGFT